MTHSNHFIEKCISCGTVISQCRCMDVNKIVIESICDNCKEITPLQQMEYKLKDIKGEMAQYLRKVGWLYTSEFPDSRWRWVKRVNNVSLAVDLENAVMIQISMEEKENAS